jgi:hypothetical protein
MLGKSLSCKRKILLAILLSAFLISALAGTFFTDLAMGDDFQLNVNMESPQNNGTYPQTVSVAFTYTSSPGSSIELKSPEYSYVLDKKEVVTFSPKFNGSVYSTTLSGLSNGVHNLTIRVTTWQEIGEWKIPSYEGYSSTVTFTIDVIRPRVKILSPEPSLYNGSDVALTFTLSEPVSQMVYCLDDMKNVSITSNATLASLSSGRHTLFMYITDEAGNTGTSETVTFDVNMPTPFATTLIAVAIIASVTVISFGLILYFLRRNKKRSGA